MKTLIINPSIQSEVEQNIIAILFGIVLLLACLLLLEYRKRKDAEQQAKYIHPSDSYAEEYHDLSNY